MFGISLKPKLAPNEHPVTIYWDNSLETDATLFYESGLYYNHQLQIAIAESDSLSVDVYTFTGPDTPPIHTGDEMELREDPAPLEHSQEIWTALQTQNEITSSGTRRRSNITSPSSSQWNQVKIWSFLAGLFVFAVISMWSLKIGSDAIDIIDDQIKEAYEQSQRTP